MKIKSVLDTIALEVTWEMLHKAVQRVLELRLAINLDLAVRS